MEFDKICILIMYLSAMTLFVFVIIPMITASNVTNETNITIEKPFSIIVIPDTQYYMQEEYKFETLNNTVNWIKNQSDIDLVLQVGDLGDDQNLTSYQRYNIFNEMNKTFIPIMGNHDIPEQFYSLFNETKIRMFNQSNLSIGIVTEFNNYTDEIIKNNNQTKFIYLTHGQKDYSIGLRNIFLVQLGHSQSYSQEIKDNTYHIRTGHSPINNESSIAIQRYDFYEDYVSSEIFSVNANQSFAKFIMTYGDKSLDYEYNIKKKIPTILDSSYNGGGSGGGGSGGDHKPLKINITIIPQVKR